MKQYVIDLLMRNFWFKSIKPKTGALCWIVIKNEVFIVFWSDELLNSESSQHRGGIAEKWMTIKIPQCK